MGWLKVQVHGDDDGGNDGDYRDDDHDDDRSINRQQYSARKFWTRYGQD